MIPVHRPSLGPEELAAVSRVFDSRWLGMGAEVREFEQKLREYLRVKHVIAVGSGTAALHLALAAAGVGDGDEVIVPSLTFASSVQAIVAVGARPVFCEVEEATVNIDVGDARRRVTPRTKAVMPVHYAGEACDMAAIAALAGRHGLKIVEDAAHAFGSTCRGRKIGTFGDATCFSFDPIKNITCGEGGAIATDDDGIAARLLPMRNVGIDKDRWGRREARRPWAYEVVCEGYRYHMSNMNASMRLSCSSPMAAFILLM